MPDLPQRRVDVARLERALAHLPKLDREAFLCKVRDGQTYAEIGVRLGLNTEKAEAHVTRALLKLDAYLLHGERPWWRVW